MSLVPPRSHSLPAAADDFRRPSVAYPPRQEPHVVCANAPLTPPLSPKPSQHIDSITIEGECTPINIKLDSQENILQPPELMDVDATSPTVTEEDSQPATRPSRNLEDEKVHLHRSGVRLSDFEVRGTLGT